MSSPLPPPPPKKKTLSHFFSSLNSPPPPIDAPPPEDYLEGLLNTKRKFIGLELQQQICLSMVDQEYHSSDFAEKLESCNMDATAHPTSEVFQDVSGRFSLGVVPGTFHQTRFSHLTTYGAKYYSYLMSKVFYFLIYFVIFIFFFFIFFF